LPEALRKTLIVFLGGGLGATLRYWLGGWILSRTGPDFPWGTFVINVSGSLVIGLFLGLALKSDLSQDWRIFVATGILGGYTTFSSFSYETISLLRDAGVGPAAFNVFGSLIFGLAAAWLGLGLARAF
jgi:CrcB protein